MHVHPAREPVNGWFHFVAAFLAAGAFAWLMADAVDSRSTRHVVAVAAYGLSAVLMFGASALYHLRPRSRRAVLYRRLDHALIYTFIAGTYTPICLLVLWPSFTGRALLVAVWGLAVAGVTMDLLVRRFRRGLGTALYLALGWAAVVIAPALLERPALGGWILTGGVFYTVGAVIYWRQRPRGRPGRFGFHEIWHVCVIAGSASHFWAIRNYVLPL